MIDEKPPKKLWSRIDSELFLTPRSYSVQDQPWRRGCHLFRRSRSHLEEADDTRTPQTLMTFFS